MTQTLDRTGNTAGDFEWMSSRRDQDRAHCGLVTERGIGAF